MSMTVVLLLTLVCISQSTCAIDSTISDYMDLNQVILPANITVTLNISTPTATINNYSIFYAMSGLSLIPKVGQTFSGYLLLSSNYSSYAENYTLEAVSTLNIMYFELSVISIALSQEYPLFFRAFSVSYLINSSMSIQCGNVTDYLGEAVPTTTLEKMHSIVGFELSSTSNNTNNLLTISSLLLTLTYTNSTPQLCFNHALVPAAFTRLNFKVAIFESSTIQNQSIYVMTSQSKTVNNSDNFVEIIDGPLKVAVMGASMLTLGFGMPSVSYHYSLGLCSVYDNDSDIYNWTAYPLLFSRSELTLNMLYVGIYSCHTFYPISSSSSTCNLTCSFFDSASSHNTSCSYCDRQALCSPYCGDGFINGVQQCDPSTNSNYNSSCQVNCTLAAGYYNCTMVGVFGIEETCITLCGDGIVVEGEQCDLGTGNGLDYCSFTCTLLQGYNCTFQTDNFTIVDCTSICGDGIVVPPQQCDLGILNGLSNYYCASDCTQALGNYNCTYQSDLYTIISCETTCDNALTQYSQQCDSGPLNGVEYCTVNCTQAEGYTCSYLQDNFTIVNCSTVCGDGIVVQGEQCDLGVLNGISGYYCGIDCWEASGFNCTYMSDGLTIDYCESSCGNGITQYGEQCDIGINNGKNDSYCDFTCAQSQGYICDYLADKFTILNCSTYCGDGIRTYDQQCDLGPLNNHSYCGIDCQVISQLNCTFQSDNITILQCNSTCGNNLTEYGQQCDYGILNGLDFSACWTECTKNVGWQCTYLPDNWTMLNCSQAVCGNGVVQSGQQCDMGDNNGAGQWCNKNCQQNAGYNCSYKLDNYTIVDCQAVCGDGLILGGQQCDEGSRNGYATSSCTLNCTLKAESICLETNNCMVITATSLTVSSFRKVPRNNAVVITLTSQQSLFGGTTINRRLLQSINPNRQYPLPGNIRLNFPYTSATIQVQSANRVAITASYAQTLSGISGYSVTLGSLTAFLPSTTDNNISLRTYTPSEYSMFDTFATLIPICAYIAATLLFLLFLFGSKLIALQMCLILQFIYGGLSLVSYMDEGLESFSILWIFNGYNVAVGVGAVEARMAGIGYRSDFLGNFNVDLAVWFLPLLTGLVLTLMIRLRRKRIVLYRRYRQFILKQLQFTVIFFLLQHLIFSYAVNIQYSSLILPGLIIGSPLLLMVIFYLFLFYQSKVELNPHKIFFGDFKKYFNSHHHNFYILFVLYRAMIDVLFVVSNGSIAVEGVLLGMTLIWTGILLLIRPYKKEHLLVPIINSAFTVLCSIFFLYHKYQSSATSNTFITYLPVVLIIILGLLFFINLIYGILKIYRDWQFSQSLRTQAKNIDLEVQEQTIQQIYEMHPDIDKIVINYTEASIRNTEAVTHEDGKGSGMKQSRMRASGGDKYVRNIADKEEIVEEKKKQIQSYDVYQLDDTLEKGQGTLKKSSKGTDS